MSNTLEIPFYKAIPVKLTRGMEYGLYIMCYKDTNHLILGAYAVSNDGLQRTHMSGPLIHFAHADLFADWLDDPEHRIELVDKVLVGSTSLAHPFSSNGEPVMLQTQTSLPMAFGKFWELLEIGVVKSKAIQFAVANAIRRCRNEVHGHPLAEDTIVISLGDGRFSWLHYDDAIDRVRLGFGAYDDAGTPRYGPTSYVFDKNTYHPFYAHHIANEEESVHIIATSAWWQPEYGTKVDGVLKKQTVTELLKLGDQIWNS